jgi:glycosyltransferase involved in cell wall biosynthesis
MRIGAICEWKVNAHYRHLIPLAALRARGHEVVHATTGIDAHDARSQPELLRGCDVILGYRALEELEVKGVRTAIARGAAFVWDTDDDLSALPRESPHYATSGGRQAQRIFAHTVGIARSAHVVTTSTEALAERYREEGIERIEPIDNHLASGAASAGRRRHDGVVIGWTAGLEHASELPRIPVVETLRRLLDAHSQLRVATLGLDLGLPRERYEHHAEVPFDQLPVFAGAWDVGIAPLADIPFNRTRSNVKLKEYASAGTPWLASPIGPYAGLGEAQGGRLVADDGWFDALDELIRRRFARGRLGRRARAWAKTQTIDAAVGRWEAVLEEAIERRREHGR